MSDTGPTPPPTVPPRELPVIDCGRRVCGMHPPHRHEHAGRPAMCPGTA